MKKFVVVVLALLLASSGMVAQDPPPKAVEKYEKLFVIVHGMMVQVKKVCKTEECATIADEGTALIADARIKQKHGLLVSEERTQFHDKLDVVLMRMIDAVKSNAANKKDAKLNLQLPDGLSCQAKTKVKAIFYDQDRCDLCYEVFEQVMEICALYAAVSPDAAIICMGWATLNFGHCLKVYCGGT
jgi:hypothetical protein